MSTAPLPPKRVALKPPLDRLVFDREDGIYRGALYRTVKDHGKVYKVRDTAKGKTLEQMLFAILHDAVSVERMREVYRYITSTEWGRELV